MAKTTHIAVVSMPLFSHQVSLVEFCKRLLRVHQNIHVTCIFPTIGTPIPATIAFLESLPSTIEYIFLTPVNKEELPKDVPPWVNLQSAVCKSLPSFRKTLSSLCSTKLLTALIIDPFTNEALEIAKEFKLPAYIYFPTSALTMSLLLYLPTLDEQVSCEYRDHKEGIQIPGFVPIPGDDLPCDFQDRKSQGYKLILQRCKRFSLADGFLVNSFFEMEKLIVKAMQERYRDNKNNVPVYTVGPIIQTPGKCNESNVSQCVTWLEKQRPNSVLYVSFGSGGTLSQKQLNELAFGLELSGQKFLWVLRAPNDSADRAFLGVTNDDPLQFLPDGFLERTNGHGLVIPSWAPQTQILSHTSTGGFLTHCGWNSILESIVVGVPMITWPLFAEQRMNAGLLTKGVKVALRPKFNENGIAEREEIAKVVKVLMLGEEGDVFRERIEKLKGAAADALKEDGSSINALSQFGTLIKTLNGH